MASVAFHLILKAINRGASARSGRRRRGVRSRWRVAARIRREAGGKVSTNVMVRDLDVAMPNAVDGRRLEVVVDGFPLFGGGRRGKMVT